MKPQNIFLVRHGQSEGNVSREIYHTKPDYAIELTPKGKEEGQKAGKDIFQLIDQGNSRKEIQFYVSPYWRTRQTYQEIKKSIPFSHKYYEDPRLREQEWCGRLRSPDTNYEEIEKERDSFGHFYYRLENAESCADVFDRVSDFLNTLHRDFEKKDYPDNAVIINHGMTMRLFLMRWFHYSVEEFELIANPKNCEFWVMKLNEQGKYDLITDIRKYEKRLHPYQFDWGNDKNEPEDESIGTKIVRKYRKEMSKNKITVEEREENLKKASVIIYQGSN